MSTPTKTIGRWGEIIATESACNECRWRASENAARGHSAIPDAKKHVRETGHIVTYTRTHSWQYGVDDEE